jgi:hypothetical protein
MYENYLGKKVVASVPWEEAREYYQDRLESSGVRIASKGSISESLRDAFLTEIESKHKATPFQVQKHAADTISAQSAATRLYETRVHSERVNPTDHSFHTKRAKALQVVSSWLSAGLLTTTSVKTVLQDTSNLSGEDIIRNALPNVALTKQAHYMGTGFSTGNTSNYVGIEKRLETFEEAHGAIARQKFERDMKRAAAKVFALETAGVLTHKQANSILSNTALTPEQIIKKAYAAVSSSLPEILEGVTRTYEGTVVTTRQAHLTVKDTDSDQRKITAATEEKALSTIVDLCNRGKMSLKTAKTLLAQNSVIEAAEKALQYATRAKTAAYTNPTANRDTESVFAAHTAAEYDSAEYDLQSEGTLEYEPEAKKQAHLSDIVIDGFYFEE